MRQALNAPDTCPSGGAIANSQALTSNASAQPQVSQSAGDGDATPRTSKLTVSGCSLGCSSPPCSIVHDGAHRTRWSSLNQSGRLHPELLMRCRVSACAAQLRYGVMKENLYFWATLAMAARSAGLSGGPMTPRLPGLPISGNMASIPAGEYMNSILAGPSPTFW